jgi:hypothetical protein
MNEKAIEGNRAYAKEKKKTVKKDWSDEQLMLNSDVLYFICALIGSRIKTEEKKHLKDLYLKCYGDYVALSSNDFSALWTNGNYDLFVYYGNNLPELV